VRDRVRNLSELVGRPVMVPEAMARFAELFGLLLPVTLVPGALTEEELADAESLYQQKYAREEWTFPKRRPFSTTLATKARSGVVMLDLELEGDRIEKASIRGDFLLARQEDLVGLLARMKGQPLKGATELVRQGSLPPDLSEALVQLLEEGGQRHDGAVP
jgi:hypothetical protein